MRANSLNNNHDEPLVNKQFFFLYTRCYIIQKNKCISQDLELSIY